VELTSPWQAVKDAGGEPVLPAPEKDPVKTVNHDAEPGSYEPDHAVGDVSAADFAGLVLPGGVGNPDKLRLVPEAVAFVKAFAGVGKPIAAICHGPWTLVEAGVVAGKTLTSWPSLRTDIRNAGGDWRDEQVVMSPEQGFDLVTSRKHYGIAFESACSIGALAAMLAPRCDELLACDAVPDAVTSAWARTPWSRGAEPRLRRLPRRTGHRIRRGSRMRARQPPATFVGRLRGSTCPCTSSAPWNAPARWTVWSARHSARRGWCVPAGSATRCTGCGSGTRCTRYSPRPRSARGYQPACSMPGPAATPAQRRPHGGSS
jgi:protease I